MPAVKLRKVQPPKRRAPRAPQARRPPKSLLSGGTSAPKSAARGPRMGLGRAQPPRERKAGVAKAKALTAPKTIGTEVQSGFTPNLSSLSGPPPESMNTAEKRQRAWQDWGTQSSDFNHQLYLAALAYGDPDLIKQFGDVVPTPTGALQTVAREEEQAKKQTGIDRNAANTFFSGMHLDDVKRLGDEAGFKRKAALDNWEKAKHELLVAIQEAEQMRDEMLSEADREDIEAFEETEPEPLAEEAPASGDGGGGGGGGGGGQGKGGGGGGKGPKVGPGKPAPKGGPGIGPGSPAKKPKGKK